MENKKDLFSGNLSVNIFLFTLPIILSSLLQLFFNAADLIVVGRFDAVNSSVSQAAIGTTTSLINLIVNFFLGISIGVNVLVARLYSAKDNERLKTAIQTSCFLGVIAGILVAVFGIMFSGEMLKLMNVTGDILPLAATYLKIYFVGAPFSMLYNFGSAIMRAAGDTKRPMIYLTAAGIVNVILNLITVIFFKMGVAGVATATTISNMLSCVLIFAKLIKTDSPIKLVFKDFKIKADCVKQVIAVGLPTGIQSTFFSISNMIIQSSVNTFGAAAMAGCGDAANIEGFVYVAMNSYSYAAVTFVSQCCGSGKTDKIGKVLLRTVMLVTVTGVIVGWGAYLAGNQLLGIYTQNTADIQAGLTRMAVIATTYFLCGIMDVITGAVRGMGESVTPMIVTLLFVCVFRIIWIATILPKYYSLTTIFVSYPVSWVLNIGAVLICYFVRKKKLLNNKKILTN